MLITNPKAFVEYFNKKIPDACREITSDDVQLMTECNLIGRHNYYVRQDIEIVRCILMYKQLRENRFIQSEERKKPHTCKRCGHPLPASPPEKRGRHGEYCVDCQSSRVRERYRKWRKKRFIVDIITPSFSNLT